jgi:periplasmic protein CpxP/Spy
VITDKMRLVAMAAVLAVAAPAAAAYAQTAPASPPPAAAGPQKRPMMDPAQRAEHRAERLRAVLQLRPEQEPALKAFIAAQQPPAGVRERRAARGEVSAMTTPQRLEARRKGMDERRARFDQRAQATLKFYSQLSPAQQKAFDAMGPRRGGHGKGGHGMGERGGRFRG